ncbi:MAG: hypothetical protein ACK4UU_09925, partial [Fimbriimonadales bacterium]
IFLGQRVRWILLERTRSLEPPYIIEPVSVEKYRVESPWGKVMTVEWRVFPSISPVPKGSIAELKVDNNLYRRHFLLQSRRANANEVELFKVPRGASLRAVPVEVVTFFPIGGYEIVVPEEGEK